MRNPSWFEALQLLGGELAKNSDEKVDEYISFLLENIGNRIFEQAPIIALCANILSDVKGVADIKSETQRKYLMALRGTLDTFKPDSAVPPKVQLEVVYALARLGASVKEHLIQATKSSYFQVRSGALKMLIVHLSNDDLFEMQHIFNDRSQEPIDVYVRALFERDENRALKLIKEKEIVSSKELKALSFVFQNYSSKLTYNEVIRIIDSIVETGGIGNSNYFAIIIVQLKRNKNLTEEIRRMLINRIERKRKAWSAIEALATGFDKDEQTWSYLSTKVSTEFMAIRIISENPEKYDGSCEALTEIAKKEKSDFRRRYALKILVYKISNDEIDRSILKFHDWYFLDPLNPITKEWIKRCAINFNEDFSVMQKRFERLARDLPITLKD